MKINGFFTSEKRISSGIADIFQNYTISERMCNFMKRKITEILRYRKIAAGCTAAVLSLIIGGGSVVQDSKVSQVSAYTDPVMEVTLEEEETPLASAPIVKTTARKDTSVRKVIMKSASKKTYTRKLPVTKKTTTVTSDTTKAVIKTETTVSKAITEKYVKKSRVKTVTTVTTTTVTTTTEKTSAASSTGTVDTTGKYSAEITQIASMMDSRVLKAYKKLGFTVEVDSSVSYAGHFDAAARKIVMQRADNTIYHELGHFAAFISGNTDKSAAFRSIYSLEKSKFTGINKAYITQNSSEYFAESVKDYILQPAELKNSRPQTYQAIADAFNKITDAQVTRIQTVYGYIWNK